MDVAFHKAQHRQLRALLEADYEGLILDAAICEPQRAQVGECLSRLKVWDFEDLENNQPCTTGNNMHRGYGLLTGEQLLPQVNQALHPTEVANGYHLYIN
jgi:hypothetical protein